MTTVTVWVFVVLLTIPPWGGPVQVEMSARTKEGCLAMRQEVAGHLRAMTGRQGRSTLAPRYSPAQGCVPIEMEPALVEMEPAR